MKKYVRYFIQLLLIGIIFATVQYVAAQRAPVVAEPEESAFAGSLKDGKYTNSFFRLELNLPPGWIKFDDAEEDAAKSIGTEGLKTDNTQFNKKLEQASKAEVILVGIAKRPLGSTENSAFAIGAGKQPSARITAKMVAEAGKSLLLKNTENKLLRDVKTEMIGGKEFASFDIELAMYGQKVPLRYYAIMVREYSLTFSMSSFDKESLEQMETALRSIRFWK